MQALLSHIKVDGLLSRPLFLSLLWLCWMKGLVVTFVTLMLALLISHGLEICQISV